MDILYSTGTLADFYNNYKWCRIYKSFESLFVHYFKLIF